AGATTSRTTAQGFLERIRTISLQLVTSAVVANREVTIRYRDADNNQFAEAPAGAVQAASNTFTYGFGIGQTTTAASPGGRLSVALADIYLFPGWNILFSVIAIDATDQISAIRGLVERYSLGRDGYPIGETDLPDTIRGRGYERALESE